MNSIVFIVICSLLTQTISIDCATGYFATASYSNVPVCYKCLDIFAQQCASGQVHGTKVTPTSVVGYKYAANGDLVRYCPFYNNAWTYYNRKENICELDCKEGCMECIIDYDYCTTCAGGYMWNKDYTCTPIVIGLQASSLALLVISLIFAIVGCVVVIKAKKNQS